MTFFIVVFKISWYTNKISDMFFELPYLWRMLWYVSLTAVGGLRSRGKVWKRPSLPADICLHCKGKPAGGLRSFCVYDCSPDFPAGMTALYGLPVHIGKIGTRTVCVGGDIA